MFFLLHSHSLLHTHPRHTQHRFPFSADGHPRGFRRGARRLSVRRASSLQARLWARSWPCHALPRSAAVSPSARSPVGSRGPPRHVLKWHWRTPHITEKRHLKSCFFELSVIWKKEVHLTRKVDDTRRPQAFRRGPVVQPEPRPAGPGPFGGPSGPGRLYERSMAARMSPGIAGCGVRGALREVSGEPRGQ